MLDNYLQQTTSADVIIQMHFSWHFNDLGTPCLLLYLNWSVMLDNYLQQTTAADVIFLGALTIKIAEKSLPVSYWRVVLLHSMNTHDKVVRLGPM